MREQAKGQTIPGLAFFVLTNPRLETSAHTRGSITALGASRRYAGTFTLSARLESAGILVGAFLHRQPEPPNVPRLEAQSPTPHLLY